MKIKIASLTVGAAFGVACLTAQADETFATLANVDAKPMTAEQLAEIEGMAHDTYPLGRLLLENTDGRIADTPAWTANHGLHPSRALSKARVTD